MLISRKDLSMKSLLTLLCLCFCNLFISQINSFDLSNDNGAATLVELPSGDLVFGGYSENSAMLTRVSTSGVIIWSKAIDFGIAKDYVLEVVLTSDNFIIGSGYSRNGSGLSEYFFAFKYDLVGNLIWDKKYQISATHNICQSISEMPNGNYCLAGSASHGGITSPMLIEISNVDGVIVWDKTYHENGLGNPIDENFFSLKTSSNAIYTAGRYETATGLGSYRPSLTRLDLNGNIIWNKTYLFNSITSHRLYCFDFLVDNDSLVSHFYGSLNGTSPPFQFGVFKTNLNGNISWAKRFSNPAISLVGINMKKCPGGYLFSGLKTTGNKDIFLAKTDEQGNLVWSKTYGSISTEDIDIASSKSSLIISGNDIYLTGRKSNSGVYSSILIKADITTGIPYGGLCYTDLTLQTNTLTPFEDDYLMNVTPNLCSEINSTLSVTPLNTSPFGGLKEVSSDSICSSDTYELCQVNQVNVYANYPSNFSFLWSDGTTNSNIVLNAIGTYSLIVSGDCNVYFDTVYVTGSTPQFSLGNDTTLCDLSSFLIAPNTNLPNSSWSDGSTGTSLDVTSSGIYWLESENNGCIERDSIEVNFSMTPNVDLGNDTSLCFSNNFLIDATTSGAQYLWNDNSTNSTLIASTTGAYFVEVNSGGCVGYDTINLVFQNIPVLNLGPDITLCDSLSFEIIPNVTFDNYLWNTTSTAPTLTINSSGDYYLTASTNNCFTSDTIEISLNQSPIIDLGPDTVLCSQISLQLDPNFVNGQYVWSDNSSNSTLTVFNSGLYFVEVTNQTCTSYDTIEVTFIDNTSLNLGPDQELCDETSYLIQAASSHDSYLWNTSETSSFISVNTSGQYNLTAYNSGCEMNDTIEIVFLQSPIVDLGNDTILCNTNLLTLTVPSIYSQILWSNGSTENSIIPITTGNYSVQVGPDNCYSTDDINIEYINEPYVYVNDTTVCEEDGLNLNFTDNPYSISLNGNSNIQYYSISDAGEYTIDASNICGQFTASFKVDMETCSCLFYLPNTFSPDGDEFNNTLELSSICPFAVFRFEIYNRWGELIYETDNHLVNWDGNYKGKIVPDGTYVWKAYYSFKDSVEELKIGHVNVIR